MSNVCCICHGLMDDDQPLVLNNDGVSHLTCWLRRPAKKQVKNQEEASE